MSQIRETFVNYLEEKCTNYCLSKKSLGNLLRAYHISCPFFMLFFVAYGPKLLAYFSVLLLITVIILFFVFKGCFMSSLEAKFCKDDFTIADPFLEILGLEINRKNRFQITLYMGSLYTMIFSAVYYWRFYMK